MIEVTNLATERQPTPITVELWSHTDLAAFKFLINEGLWAADRHDDSLREAVAELCEEFEITNVETVGEAFYAFIDKMREFVEEKQDGGVAAG